MTDALIHTTAPRADAAVIWLHGLGADGHDFLPIVPRLGLPPTARIRFVFPHAPRQAVTINTGYRMRAWYDIRSPDLEREVDYAGIARSVALLDGLIEAQRAAGIEARRIVLAGFSQGGVIALHAGLRAGFDGAGVLALSTYLPPAPTLCPRPGLPVFQAHGECDEVVPPAAALAARDWMRAAGCALEWHAWPMGHSLCDAEIDAIGRWLSARLALPG